MTRDTTDGYSTRYLYMGLHGHYEARSTNTNGNLVRGGGNSVALNTLLDQDESSERLSMLASGSSLLASSFTKSKEVLAAQVTLTTSGF